MRVISSELQAIQRMRSPQARVTVRVEARGQNPAAPAVAWRALVGNSGQHLFSPVSAVGLADGRVLKFVGEASAIRQMVVEDPTSAASWTSASAGTIRPHGAAALAALRFAASSIRLFYIHAGDGNVYTIQSTNNGASWSSPVTVYAGGDAAADLVIAYSATMGDGPWFFGFSTYNGGTGEYRPRFGYYDGAAWVTHAYDSGWRAAGVSPYTGDAAPAVLVFRQRDRGASRLRAMTKQGGSYGAPRDIDQTQAGLFGLGLAYYRFCQLPEFGCMLGVAGEYAVGAGGYAGVCGLFAGSAPLVDETIILPSISAPVDQADFCLCTVGQDLYWVGDTVVYRGAAQPAPSAPVEPIRYRYDNHILEIEFQADAFSSGSIGAAPLQVGQVVVVERALRWEGQAGSETLRAYVLRVERGSDRVTVWAADPVGFLGVVRCRRPSILNDGSVAGCAEIMRRLCARYGVSVAVDDSSLYSAPVLPITLQPAESLLGAAYRVGSQTNIYLVPANDGAFAITLIAPPSSDGSGDYADVPHAYGPGAYPVIEAREVADLRRLAFAYILGAYSTDPEDGAAVAMAAGPVLPNTRPIAYSLTNQRYNSAARVQAAATAEAERQRKLAVDAVVVAHANLALELYDIVEVTDAALGWTARRLRVRRLAEEWNRGRLVQTLYLGDDLIGQ